MAKKLSIFIAFCTSILMLFSTSVVSLALFEDEDKKDFIRWVDFKVTYEALCQAYEYDVGSVHEKIKINWLDLLAYSACKNGNNFGNCNSKHIDNAAKSLKSGIGRDKLKDGLKYYDYYYRCFDAVLGGFLGHFRAADGSKSYGLIACSPIAKNYWYTSYRDFGSARKYGFRRRHLGNDLLGSVGTPIIAVEGGVVGEVGWNMYGGWRIGILCGGGTRYYYYAHLRRNKPYYREFKKGDRIEAGEIIGYLGNTGYSRKENVNMSGKPHLHFGLQLIFDESQVKGANEIWIDNYELLRFLQKNRARVKKDEYGKLVSLGVRVRA